jgi:processive 1,2-diacylglycerol beta-glucosyltransferase
LFAFQKTGLYKKTLSTIKELSDFFNEDERIKRKIELETINAITALTKGIAGQDERESENELKQSTVGLMSLMSLLDVTENKNGMKTEMIKKLENLQKEILDFRKDRKKILILTCEMGKGHISASNAILDALHKTYGYDYDVELIDFMEFMNSAISKIGQKTYDGSVKFMPLFYKLFYESTNKKWPVKLLNQVNYPFVLSKLKKFFEEKNPALIISTFPLWDYVTAQVWKKINKNAKFISIVTDSTSIHKFWIIADIDYHIVCNKDTGYVLEKYGVKKEEIKVLGFPVRLDFLEKPDHNAFLNKYSFDAKKPTILFLPTAQSANKNVKLMKDLMADRDSYNIVVITGRDSTIKTKLEKIIKGSKVLLLGWTNNMPEFIQNADIVITKAGGATVMECIAAAKPIIITSVIPGQEKGNADLVMEYELGIILDKKGKNLQKGLKQILSSYDRYQKNLLAQSRPDAAIKIAEFIHQIL